MNNARYRTSPALTIIPHSQDEDGRAMIGIFEFISNSFAYCSADCLIWLSLFKDWKTLGEANTKFPLMDSKDFYDEFEPLIAAKFLACEGTHEADLQDQYLKEWNIGYPAALFHFSTLNSSYCGDSDAQEYSSEVFSNKLPVSLTLNSGGPTIALPNPYKALTSDLIRLMASRRTIRSSTHSLLNREAIGACLFAGMGITGFVKEKSGFLPLSMTPSGGARNPYEAFVFLKKVRETEPGLYHYNAMSHCLELMRTIPIDLSLSEYFGGQAWVDEMAVVVVLVAFMERTSWKYANGSAYRVVYLEAGHIAQNAMLAAIPFGLTVCPTAALSHQKLNNLIGLNGNLTHTAIYAFTLDKAQSSSDTIFPNEKLTFNTGIDSN